MTTEQLGSETGEGQDKTFTQSELDTIIKDRLSRERAKYADYEDLKAKAAAYDESQEAAKTELQKALERAEKAEAAVNAYQAEAARNKAVQAVAAATGVDAGILGLMRGDSQEEIQANADALKAKMQAVNPYPATHDNGSSGASGTRLTKAEILGITDERKRLEAIKQNIDLWE